MPIFELVKYVLVAFVLGFFIGAAIVYHLALHYVREAVGTVETAAGLADALDDVKSALGDAQSALNDVKSSLRVSQGGDR